MMSDLQIKMTDPIHRMECRVIYGDTDAGGFVYNANYLRYFEMGRTEMMRSLSLPYSLIEERGLILPVTESYLRYKAPAYYDDIITITTCLLEVKRYTCRFNYKIVRHEKNDKEKLLVKGFTVHACIDRNGKLTQFPEDIRQKMVEFCQNIEYTKTSP